MIWVIANKAEEDGTFPTYRHYKKAFADGEIDIHCACQDDDFSFLKKDDVVLMRTRDENINKKVADAQVKIGFKSTLESPLTNHLTHDKNAVKTLLRQIYAPFPETINLFNVTENRKYFVKPLYGENSTGIDESSICNSKEEVLSKYTSLLESGIKPMIEYYIEGFDVTTSVFKTGENGSLEICSVVTEANNKHNLQTADTKKNFSFTAVKYQNTFVDMVAKKIFDAIGAKHYLRIDFRIAKELPYVIDINMIPGLAPDGYMSICMKSHGVEYLDFIRKVVGTAS